MLEARRKLEALAQMSGSEALRGVATLFKRVKNITKDVRAAFAGELRRHVDGSAEEPAELALLSDVEARAPGIRARRSAPTIARRSRPSRRFSPSVAKFFDDVLVMADDEALRTARLALVARLRDLILDIADISEIVTES